MVKGSAKKVTKSTKKAAKKAAKPVITVTLAPTPVTEIGFTPSGDLSITKTDNHGGSSITSTTGTVVPGLSNTYTIVAANSGPTAASGVAVTDALALNPDITSDTWTATQSGGASGFTAAGTGNIADSVNLPAGASVTYTVVAAIKSSAMGTLTNTATITTPPGFSDTNPGNNTATDTDTLAPDDGLTITKIDDAHGSVTAGTPITYTIVVTDEGPSDTSNLKVVDSLPAQGLTNISSPNLPAGVTFSAGDRQLVLGQSSHGAVGHPSNCGNGPVGGNGTHLHQHGHSVRHRRPAGLGHRRRHPEYPGHPGDHQDRWRDLYRRRQFRYLYDRRLQQRAIGCIESERRRHPSVPGLHRPREPQPSDGRDLQPGHRYLVLGLSCGRPIGHSSSSPARSRRDPPAPPT